MENQERKQIQMECTECNTKFDVWVTTTNFTPEREELIRKNIALHCPVCNSKK